MPRLAKPAEHYWSLEGVEQIVAPYPEIWTNTGSASIQFGLSGQCRVSEAGSARHFVRVNENCNPRCAHGMTRPTAPIHEACDIGAGTASSPRSIDFPQ